jgi:oligosaccharyltransferase complex subunit delta (ribophorin II)
MYLSHWPLQLLLLLSSAITTFAAASWSFTDATVSVQGKGTGVAGGFKEKCEFLPSFASRTGLTEPYRLVEHKPLSKVVELGVADTLKIILTAQEGKTAKRPHQAFLLLRDVDTGLDISYAFNVKDNGKAKIDLVMQHAPILL